MANINDVSNPFHEQQEVGAIFHPVPVLLPPPEDWIPGPQLFPHQVISGYHADYNKYDADSWAKYILEKADGYKEATSCASYSGERVFSLVGLTRTCRTDFDVIPAINSGSSPKDRFWFGYIFRGGRVSVEDFQREDGVEGSRAYR